MTTEAAAATATATLHSPTFKNYGKKKKNGGRVQGQPHQQQFVGRQNRKSKNKNNNKMDDQQQGSRPGGGVGAAEASQAKERMAAKFRPILREFLLSNDRVYSFDSSLSKKQRAVVHEVSNSLGLKSKSAGRGNQRKISVYKRGNEFEGDKKETIPYLALSTEGKKILNDLFTRYPPGEGGKNEAIEKRGISNREKIKSGMHDEFFLKPSTSQAEIKKKVEALSSRLERDADLKQITDKRSKLPIASFKDAITSAVNSHQVVLISGETGCGKTTQVPQFLLESMWASGKACKIVCTQPRRISAISVAERISCERGESVGGDVGYKIRLESTGGKHSSILFCTNGVLLKVLVSSNPIGSKGGLKNQRVEDRLSDITHIVVDEIHERDRFADLMLAILRDMLPSYPHLRLILMSATLDAERFANYFDGCPIIGVPGFTYPVKRFYLEDTLLVLQSKLDTRSDAISASAPIEDLALTEDDKAALDDAINSAWIDDDFDPLLDLVTSKETHKVYNYQHSQTGMTPLMVFAGKGRATDVLTLLTFGADFHLKATNGLTAVDLAERENHQEVSELIKENMESALVDAKSGKMLLDKYLAEASELIDVVLVERLLKKICCEQEDGAILVFLPGWEEISRVRDRLLKSPLFSNASAFSILPLHSMIPSEEQKKVFQRPPSGCRKIILSTNIAETAVTIDDVVYVIDCGRMKEKSYDPYRNVSTLESQWISKASAKQRAGRAGRCQPGICYHLYSKVRAASLPDFPIPELRRMPIEELCLQVKILDPSCALEDFLQKTLDPPVPETIRNAILALQDIGALTLDEKLTELGEKLASLPVHPSTGRMIFFALLVNCLDPALTLACAYDCRDPFVLPMEQAEKKKADAAKSELASLYDGHSDHLAVVAAFECWKKAKEKGQLNLFCSQYFVSTRSMHMLFRMRKQLQRELVRLGFIPEDVSGCNLNARDPGIVHAVLVSGLYPMVGKLLKPRKKSQTVVEIANGDRARINHRSNNSRLSLKDEQLLLAFHEITRGDGGTYIRSSTVVGPLSVLLFAKDIAVAPASGSDDQGDRAKSNDGDMDIDNSEDDERNGKDREVGDGDNVLSSPSTMVTVVVDRWLSFRLKALDIAQIYCLRELLADAILFKVRRPSTILPPDLGACMYALARLLSYDGLSGISLPPPKSTKSSASTGKPNKMTRKPRRKGMASNFLISLMSLDYHHKPMDIDYSAAGLENEAGDHDGHRSVHIHEQSLPFAQNAAVNVSTNERYGNGNGSPRQRYYQESPQAVDHNGHRSVHIHEQSLPFAQNAAFNASTDERHGNGSPRQRYYQESPQAVDHNSHLSIPIHDQSLPFARDAAFNTSTNERHGNGSPRQRYYQKSPQGNRQNVPYNGPRTGVDVSKKKLNGKGRAGQGILQPAALAYKAPKPKTPKKALTLVGYGAGTFGPYGPTRGDSLKRQREIS